MLLLNLNNELCLNSLDKLLIIYFHYFYSFHYSFFLIIIIYMKNLEVNQNKSYFLKITYIVPEFLHYLTFKSTNQVV